MIQKKGFIPHLLQDNKDPNFKNSKKSIGFTLVELLVVISIIALLRKADINQLAIALQLYYDDYDKYPSEAYCDSSIGSCGHACPCSGGSNWSTTSGIYTGLVNQNYISVLPIDPINNDNYYYWYEPDCNQGNCPSPAGCCYYQIGAYLEEGGTFILKGY